MEMKGFWTLLITLGTLAAQPVISFANDADIYAIKFSEDGRYLITGGSGGKSSEFDENYTGGIKIWDVESGDLVKAFGQQRDIRSLFGDSYGRVGKRRWAIHSFKDIVFNGSYPEGKVLLLPSSLGEIRGNDGIRLPPLIGGYINISDKTVSSIDLAPANSATHKCGDQNAAYEYLGPVVASENGRYAAVAINTCKASDTLKKGLAGYDTTLMVMDLTSLEVTHQFENIDSGMYALGVTDNGKRIAYVGRDRFAVVDLEKDKRHTVEEYPDALFQIPRQFSALYFDKTGSKLVSLHNIYDIANGTEKSLSWPKDSVINKGRTSSVRVSPNLGFFVLVKPARSMIVFGEDGLPNTYGKADRVFMVDSRSGEETELPLTHSNLEGKRCVTDISHDSQRIAVACTGGLIKVFNAQSQKVVWEQRNIGYRKEKLDKNLIQAQMPEGINAISMLEILN